MTTFEPSAAPPIVRRDDQPTHDSPPTGRGSAPLRKIGPLEVQRAWSHNEPDQAPTMTELLVAALRAKQNGDHPRALLLLGLVNRRLAACQFDAEQALAREHTEAEL